MLGFDDWKDLEPENKRKIDGYVEEKLKQALNTQLEELEEKSKIAEQARAYFGEDMYKKLMEIDGSRSEALMFDQDGSSDDELKPGEANDTANTLSKTLTLGDVVSANATTNKFKAKVIKHSSKSKTTKSNPRRNSKQPRPKSFVEQNIKSAKTTLSRRQSELPGDNAEEDPDPVSKNVKSSNLNKRNSISQGKSRSNNTAAQKANSKEQKALHQAYLCLIEESKRRKEVRKNITVKFGRANAKLKLIMAQQKSGDPVKDSLVSLITKKKTNTEQKQSQEDGNKRKGKAFAKVQNYNDPDRI